jgi:serine/threonine-protein kinase
MGWRDALVVVVKVARAIHHAHEHGVVHRDLKPANIMLLDARTSGGAARAEAAVKIMDFGVARLESLGARLTGPGQSFGSPLYTSPEQALGENSSGRSDIFSLGSVLCTLLLGRPWFAAPSIPEIVARVVHAGPPRVSSLQPGVPMALDAVVAAALAKREDDRYATAADMAEDLDEVLAGGTPKHAGAVGRSTAPARAAAEDPLLEGLVAPRRSSAPDPSSALASLLDEATHSIPRPQASPAPASKPAARRWVAAAGAVIGVALLAAAAFIYGPRRPAPEVAVAPSVSIPPQPEVSALPTPKAISPDVFLGPGANPAAPSVPLATPDMTPASAGPPASTSSPPVVEAKERPAPRTPTAESPTTDVSAAGEVAAVTLPQPVARTRIRFNVEHPLENGRLIVWIDGVVAFEEKLRAPVSKKIVAIKVREGRIEKLLDVEPGRHEVRVEVTWGQERRVATKVADAAPGATGLIEVRVGGINKGLTLQWSRLTKE